MSCALCGSDHHNRSACPWGKVHRAAQTVILVALLCAAPIYGALMDADRDLAEAKEVAEAQHSRDWAGAHVCGAAAHALWVDDKTLQCVSVVAGGKP